MLIQCPKIYALIRAGMLLYVRGVGEDTLDVEEIDAAKSEHQLLQAQDSDSTQTP